MTAPKADRGRKVAAPPETPEIALSLAKAGWPVFPVTIYENAEGKRSKVPAVKWKDEATTSGKTVREWWAGEHSGRWIGVYAGKAGIVVLDVDPGGDGSLAQAGLVPPKTFSYPTHRKGGRHDVYAAPEGIELTIARDLIVEGEKLAGIDVRSGAGLMVYYGPALKGAPTLAPAPDWLLVERGATSQAGDGADRAPSADEAAYRERLIDGKPTKDVRSALKKVKSKGMDHDDMLAAVTELVALGVRGHRGVDVALDVARETYAEGWPDAGRHWDNAVTGSIRRLGLPPATFEITKAERREIKRRNRPEAIEEARIERRAEKVAALVLDAEDMTDDALAERFLENVRDMWANTLGTGLLHYEGGVWAPRDRAILIDHARLFLRVVRAEATRLAILRGDKKGEVDAKRMGQRGTMAAVADLAAGALLADAPDLDAHPDLLNTPTGVVDLKTGKLLPSSPSYFFTRVTAASYDPKADQTLWRKALSALPAEIEPWLRVRLGQSITGYPTDDDALVIFEGAGENGKTTILHAPKKALGGYAVTLSERILLGDPSDHPTSLMTLMGARMGVIEELPEGRSLNVKRLKDIVGTPEITARKMRQDEVTFPNQSCLFVSTNYLPIVAETDHGTWRRLFLVHFGLRFVRSKKKVESKRDRVGDPRLKHELAESPDAGVLRWLVDGAREWYALGRRMPEAPRKVEKATAKWRLDADPVLAYTAERLVKDERFGISSNDLVQDFNTWLERRGHKPWSAQTVNSRFGGHVSMDGIARRMVKWSNKIAPSRPDVFGLRPIPKTTTSWRGIRFAHEPAAYKSEAERDAEAFADLASRASK